MANPIPRKTRFSFASSVAIVATVGGVMLGVALLGCARYYLRYFTIPQNGMYPTLPAHARFIVRQHAYESVADVHRGDVIVYSTLREGSVYDWVWRVVALPGDRVTIQGDTIAINSHLLTHRPALNEGGLRIVEESNGSAVYRVAYSKAADPEPRPATEITVPQWHVFAMGDNRDDAYDCRFTGPVGFWQIRGKVVWF